MSDIRSQENRENQFSGENHSFDVKLAVKYGPMEAVIIHHLLFWINFNRRMEKGFKDGRTWTYQTINYITNHFPYMTTNQVKDILDKLCRGKSRKSKKEGLDFAPILMKGNHNEDKYDHTQWYAFIDEKEWGIEGYTSSEENVEISTIDSGNETIPHGGNFHYRKEEIPPSNKDINTDNTKDRNTEENTKRESALIFFGEDFKNVKLTSEEHQKLLDKLGSEKLKSLINSLSLYIAQKGDKYKNHYATILKWVMKEKEESSPDSGTPPQFKLAKHRENSKLAFESSKDPWEPNVVWVGAPPGFQDKNSSQEESK